MFYYLTEALPAVTVPFFLKIAGSLARPSIVVCGRGCSSTSNISFPEKFKHCRSRSESKKGLSASLLMQTWTFFAFNPRLIIMLGFSSLSFNPYTAE